VFRRGALATSFDEWPADVLAGTGNGGGGGGGVGVMVGAPLQLVLCQSQHQSHSYEAIKAMSPDEQSTWCNCSHVTFFSWCYCHVTSFRIAPYT
jgi:hypothetical protein